MNIGKMMQQAQAMQKQMAKMQEELANEKVEGSAGGGMVKVTVTGTQEIVEIKINPEAVDPSDVEMLEDLILAATREAMEKSKELATSKMGKLTGGMSLPGLF